MTKQVINVGTAINSRNGDTLHTAFLKVNENFTELYALANADVQIPSQTGKAGKVLKTTGSSLLFENISYNELTDRPTLFNGSYNDLSNKPLLFSGNYNDLTNKPDTILVSSLKSIVASSVDFADFQSKIAAL